MNGGLGLRDDWVQHDVQHGALGHDEGQHEVELVFHIHPTLVWDSTGSCGGPHSAHTRKQPCYSQPGNRQII